MLSGLMAPLGVPTEGRGAPGNFWFAPIAASCLKRLRQGPHVVSGVVGVERDPDTAAAGAGDDPVFSCQRGLDLVSHGGGVSKRDNVPAGGPVAQWPVRGPAQRRGPL